MSAVKAWRQLSVWRCSTVQRRTQATWRFSWGMELMSRNVAGYNHCLMEQFAHVSLWLNPPWVTYQSLTLLTSDVKCVRSLVPKSRVMAAQPTLWLCVCVCVVCQSAVLCHAVGTSPPHTVRAGETSATDRDDPFPTPHYNIISSDCVCIFTRLTRLNT